MKGRDRVRGAWRGNLASQVQRLRDEITTLPPAPEAELALFESYKGVVERHLDGADRALKRASLSDWYSGAAIETASASLHRASETLLMIQSPVALATELPDVEAAFESNLALDDPRRLELAPALKDASDLLLEGKHVHEVPAVLRGRLRAARRAANAVSDAAQASVRRWRNALLWGGLSMSILVLAVAIIHAFVPDFLSLSPSGMPGGTEPVGPWAVELVGAVGGALGTLLALSRFSGFTDPFGLPTLQAMLRIPTAMATSLFGVVLMQTAALGAFQPQTEATKVLAFAFIFGYAQEPFLRMLDRQAGKVLDPARDKSDPVKPSSPQRQGGDVR